MSENAEKKTVLVGVTGCIGAYKACELVRALQKDGYRVKVVMTKNATEFVGPATFRALTNEPVAVSLFSQPADPIYHISLAQEADCFIIAPATANVIAKMAHGLADDLLTTTALACKAPIVVAPAMNVNMYENAATQENLQTLVSRGARIVDAEEGYLACGDTGKGRLASIPALVNAVNEAIGKKQDLAGKRVLITAGPTQEAIDPVRYITNRSSGKMGFALAEAALDRGAQVVLVSGPVSLKAPDGAQVVNVETAAQMLAACEEAFPGCDLAFFAAAVCDMRPELVYGHKLKKTTDASALETISMVENPDILKTCALSKRSNQRVVGFAAETDDLLQNGQAKLASKGADFIVANDVSGGKVFGSDQNEACLISAAGVDRLGAMSKRALADLILDKVQ